MFKALLFLCVGVGIHTVFGTQDFRRFSNASRTLPGPRALLSVANLALLGFPFLAGFYRKDSILEGFYRAAQRFGGLVAFLIGVGLTTAYRLKLTRLALLGSLDPAPATLNGGGSPPESSCPSWPWAPRPCWAAFCSRLYCAPACVPSRSRTSCSP